MIDRVKHWLNKPYSDDMNVYDWFVFLGFVAIVTLIWSKFIKFSIGKLP
jgi:hypothetical protein